MDTVLFLPYFIIFFKKKDRELLHNSKIRGNFALAKREQRLDRDQALG